MQVSDNKENGLESLQHDIPFKKRSLIWKNSVPLKKRPLHRSWLSTPPHSPINRMTDFNQKKIIEQPIRKPSREDGVFGNSQVISLKEQKRLYTKGTDNSMVSVKQEKIDPCYGDIDAKPTTSDPESCSSPSPMLPKKSHWDLNIMMDDWGEPLPDEGMDYSESGNDIESMEEINVKDHKLLKLPHSAMLPSLQVTSDSLIALHRGPVSATPLQNLCVTKKSWSTTSCKTVKSEPYEMDGGSLTMGNAEKRNPNIVKFEPCDSSLASLSPNERPTSGSEKIIVGSISCYLQLRIPDTDGPDRINDEHVESMSVSAGKDAETSQVLTGTSILNSDSSVGGGDLTGGVLLDLDSSVKKIASSSNSDFHDDDIEDGEVVRDLETKRASFFNVNACLDGEENRTECRVEKEKPGDHYVHCAKDVVCETTVNENHTDMIIKKISNESNSALTAVEPNLNSGSNESSSRFEKKLSSRVIGRESQRTRVGSCRDHPRGYEKDRNRDEVTRKSGYEFPLSRGRFNHKMENLHGHRNHPSPEFRSEQFDRYPPSRISSEASFAARRREGRGNMMVEHRTMRHVNPGSNSYVHRGSIRRSSISPDQRRIPLNISYMRSPPRLRSSRMWSPPRRLPNEFYAHSELIPCRFERVESPVGVDSFPSNPSFVSHHRVHQGMRQMGYPTRPEGGRNFQRNVRRMPPRLIGRRVDSEEYHHHLDEIVREDRNYNGHRGFVHSRPINHRNGHGSSNPRNFSRPIRYQPDSEEAFPHREMQELGGMDFSDDDDDNNDNNSSRSKRRKP